MTMPEILDEILSQRDAARKAGATEAELDAIRERILAANGKSATPPRQWQPSLVRCEPEHEPERRPINSGRKYSNRQERF